MPRSKHLSPNEHIKRRREYAGLAFFSGAFRPFFLAASLWAIFSIGMWLYVLNDSAAPAGLIGNSWHIHEMVFGFISAALAGFILTAIPNWTGRLPVRGGPLAGLALLWLLGRAAIFASAFFGLTWIALFDLLFPFALFFVVLREIVSGKNKRNLPVAILFGVLALANTVFHAEGYVNFLDGHGWRLGLGVVIMIISVIGGRIVPSFTRNWLAKNGKADKSPAPPNKFDKGILLFCGFGLLSWVMAPTFIGSAIVLMLAGLGQLIRLSRWRGMASVSESIIFVLHVGYAWIGLGLLLLGLSIVWDGFIASTAIHALTIGAISTMIPAVMSRASLGHSGLAIKAGPWLSFAYALISLSVIVRLSVGIFADHYMLLVNISGALWIFAFALYTVKFTPLYFKPRLKR